MPLIQSFHLNHNESCMSGFQPHPLMFPKSVLRTWVRSERNCIIWNAFYSFNTLLSTITIPRLSRQKIKFRQQLRPYRVNVKVKRTSSTMHNLTEESFLFYTVATSKCGGWGRGAELITSHVQRLYPNPILFFSEIHFLFYLLTGLNNLAALRDILKPYIVIKYPWTWGIPLMSHHLSGILSTNA